MSGARPLLAEELLSWQQGSPGPPRRSPPHRSPLRGASGIASSFDLFRGPEDITEQDIRVAHRRLVANNPHAGRRQRSQVELQDEPKERPTGIQPTPRVEAIPIQQATIGPLLTDALPDGAARPPPTGYYYNTAVGALRKQPVTHAARARGMGWASLRAMRHISQADGGDGESDHAEDSQHEHMQRWAGVGHDDGGIGGGGEGGVGGGGGGGDAWDFDWEVVEPAQGGRGAVPEARAGKSLISALVFHRNDTLQLTPEEVEASFEVETRRRLVMTRPEQVGESLIWPGASDGYGDAGSGHGSSALSLPRLAHGGEPHGSTVRVASRIAAAFNFYDVNRSGYLDGAELRAALQYYGLDVTSSAAQALVKDYDATPDGKLDMVEFAALISDVERAGGSSKASGVGASPSEPRRTRFESPQPPAADKAMAVHGDASPRPSPPRAALATTTPQSARNAVGPKRSPQYGGGDGGGGSDGRDSHPARQPLSAREPRAISTTGGSAARSGSEGAPPPPLRLPRSVARPQRRPRYDYEAIDTMGLSERLVMVTPRAPAGTRNPRLWLTPLEQR
jgi:hypothetical protein